MSLYAQIAAAFDPTAGEHVSKIDPTSDRFKIAKAVEETFTRGVAFLKDEFPNERIRTLGQNIWDVCHHQHVVMALGPPVPALTFAMMKQPSGLIQALIFPPTNWLERVAENQVLQLGAIVMVGSQAVDFYNGRFQDQAAAKVAIQRSHANEAEYLRALPSATLDDYQEGLLTEFPIFPAELRYSYKAVEPKN